MKNPFRTCLQRFRGWVYRVLTRGAFAQCVGRLFRKNRIPKIGYFITVPASSGPEIKSSIFFGMYEFAERKLIKKFLPPNLDCVELGASIGVVSREILQIIGKDKRLIAVEAMPDLCEILKTNINSQNLENRARIVQGAIAYGSDFIDFRIGSEHNAGGVAKENDDVEAVRVPTTSLTTIVGDLAGKPYSLVMDIEGAEHDLIKNCRGALGACQYIIAEVHGSDRDTSEFVEEIQRIGFNVAASKHTVWVFSRS